MLCYYYYTLLSLYLFLNPLPPIPSFLFPRFGGNDYPDEEDEEILRTLDEEQEGHLEEHEHQAAEGDGGDRGHRSGGGRGYKDRPKNILDDDYGVDEDEDDDEGELYEDGRLGRNNGNDADGYDANSDYDFNEDSDGEVYTSLLSITSISRPSPPPSLSISPYISLYLPISPLIPCTQGRMPRFDRAQGIGKVMRPRILGSNVGEDPCSYLCHYTTTST